MMEPRKIEGLRPWWRWFLRLERCCFRREHGFEASGQKIKN